MKLPATLPPYQKPLEELSTRMDSKAIDDIRSYPSDKKELSAERLWSDVLPHLTFEELSQTDDDGRTIFHKACIYGNVAMIKSLKEYCPQLMSVADNWGFLPCHLAPTLDAVMAAMPQGDDVEKFWMLMESGVRPKEMILKITGGKTVQDILKLMGDECSSKSLQFILSQLKGVEAIHISEDFPLEYDQAIVAWIKRISLNFNVMSSYIKVVGTKFRMVFDEKDCLLIHKCMKRSLKLDNQIKKMEKRLERKRQASEVPYESKRMRLCTVQ